MSILTARAGRSGTCSRRGKPREGAQRSRRRGGRRNCRRRRGCRPGRLGPCRERERHACGRQDYGGGHEGDEPRFAGTVSRAGGEVASTTPLLGPLCRCFLRHLPIPWGVAGAELSILPLRHGGTHIRQPPIVPVPGAVDTRLLRPCGAMERLAPVAPLPMGLAGRSPATVQPCLSGCLPGPDVPRREGST